MRQIPHWVQGVPYEAPGQTSPVYDPATGDVVATVDLASDDVVDHVVDRAAVAAVLWRDATLATRTSVLFRFRELLVANSDELARVITREHGKTVSDALGELARGIENVEYACGLSDHLKGEFATQVADGVDVHSLHEPVGVVAAVTPFNFPVMVPLWMTANALAAGNAVVLKPSERDPSASVRLGEILRDAGLPDGVFNVVHGDGAAVRRLLTHPSVDAVSFVGSTAIARQVYEVGSANGKRVQALGGAKNHMVVLGDADLDVAADAAVSAAFGSAGERCMAVSVVVAVGDVADELIERLAARMDVLRVGPGDDPASDLGPLITEAHRDRVAGYVEGARVDGVRIVRDGRQHTTRDGFYLGPSLLDGVRPGLACYDDELFGPVLGVARVDTLNDAIELVNANPYGNGVALFTRDGHAARTFSRAVTVGMIGINVPVPVPVASFSFGGWKDSLFGHAHIYGPEGFRFYTRTKVVTTRWPRPSESSVNLNFPTNE